MPRAMGVRVMVMMMIAPEGETFAKVDRPKEKQNNQAGENTSVPYPLYAEAG